MNLDNALDEEYISTYIESQGVIPNAPRVRMATEKGKQYYLNRARDVFKAAKRAFRKQVNRVQLLLVSENEVSVLENVCKLFVRS